MKQLTKIFVVVWFLSTAYEAAAINLKAKLPLSRISTISVNGKTVICALFPGRNKPLVAKRVRGLGSVYKTVRATAAQRAACSEADSGGLGTISLAALPDASSIVGSGNQSTVVRLSAVSGTPPTLPELGQGSIKNIFWRSGVVDSIAYGTPTSGQCAEFFNSTTDGESGGTNACYLSQGVGQSFETVLRSGTSLCYMKNAMTDAMVSAGVVTRVRGRFPNNDVTQIFSPPSSGSRIVEVRASAGGGENSRMYIRVYGSNTNRDNQDKYRFDFWSCEPGQSQPQEIENTLVKVDGRYISSSRNAGDHGVGQTLVTAYLTPDGEALVFDRSRSRTVEAASTGGSFRFKSQMEIDSENVIRTKVSDLFNNISRKGYSVSRASGSTVAELRFLEGAYKEQYRLNGGAPEDRTSGVEYRDTFYASAPSQSYLSELASVDLNTDPFYSTLDDVVFDPTGYSCSVTPDIVVGINLAAVAFAPIEAICEGVRLDGMDFCNSDNDVSSAYQNFNSVCPH
jgi:hypothetical protein